MPDPGFRILLIASTAVLALAAIAVISLIRTRHAAGPRAEDPQAAWAPGPRAADPDPSAGPQNGSAPPPVSPAMTLGPPGAPVTIVQFGDYQCTSCAAFARDCQPALIRRYVQAGVIRLVWRDFPCTDGQSFRAAVAARAAGMQGKFWAFHDYLLTCQPSGQPPGLLTDAYLKSVAKRIGLDMAAFKRDLASPALAAAVQADSTFGRQSGVPRTPAFLINGRPLVGARPLPAFETAIAKARAGRPHLTGGRVPGRGARLGQRAQRPDTVVTLRPGVHGHRPAVRPDGGRLSHPAGPRPALETAWWKEPRRWPAWRGTRTPVRGMPGTKRQETSTGPRLARRDPGRRGARATVEHALISLQARNGLQVPEAAGADISTRAWNAGTDVDHHP